MYNIIHCTDAPTSGPTLSGYDGQIFYEGESSVTLICTQSGGYPLASYTITWNCLSLTGTDVSTSTDSVSQVIIQTLSLYNGGTCQCIATHTDSNVGYTDNTVVTVTVYCKFFLYEI